MNACRVDVSDCAELFTVSLIACTGDGVVDATGCAALATDRALLSTSSGGVDDRGCAADCICNV